MLSADQFHAWLHPVISFPSRLSVMDIIKAMAFGVGVVVVVLVVVVVVVFL